MLKHGSHHDHAKSITYFFIVLLALGILLLFNTYSEDIINSNSFPLFMTLSVVAAGLLVGLLYLVSNSTHKVKSHSVKSKSTKGGKAKKRK